VISFNYYAEEHNPLLTLISNQQPQWYLIHHQPYETLLALLNIYLCNYIPKNIFFLNAKEVDQPTNFQSFVKGGYKERKALANTFYMILSH
jgi:hypothetical protein